MGSSLRVSMTFDPEDQAWLRRDRVSVPQFWQGSETTPLVGDAIRFAGRQFIVRGRIWEHDGSVPVLRLVLSSGGAESDTVFSPL